MKSKAYVRWESDHTMERLGRLMDQRWAEHSARLDQSLRRMDRWMAVILTLYVIARLAIWKLL